MKLLNLDSSKTYSIPDLYLNIGHLLDHFMMLIFAKAAYDAGREFGLSYEEIIIYGTLGVVLFGAAAPLAGWLADKFSRAILITIYPFGLALGALLTAFSSSVQILGISFEYVVEGLRIKIKPVKIKESIYLLMFRFILKSFN